MHENISLGYLIVIILIKYNLHNNCRELINYRSGMKVYKFQMNFHET